MKKILIGYLIALTIGNLIGCTNEKVNNETNETNTTTNENTENQETNKTEEYQPKCATVNYDNKEFIFTASNSKLIFKINCLYYIIYFF